MANGTRPAGLPGRARAGRAGGSGDGGADDPADHYDVLILDAGYKQSLLCARSLGQAGLRVALAESAADFRPRVTPPSFRSRYCSRQVILPSYVTDAAAFADAIVDFVREHPTAVVIPMGDATIAAAAPARERLAELGCFLALAPASALETANDKDRTLRIAAGLGIQVPPSVSIGSVADLSAAQAQFGFPFVLKPTMSWTGNSATRAVPVEVVDREEAIRATERLLAEGASILAQEFVGGRRERVALFLVAGEVMASCTHVAERMSPPFGGVSTLRETITAPADILDASIQLAVAIGIEGPCEVEFRRDARGRPRLMEVNARLAGTLAHAKASGVDLSLLTWQWATGREVGRVKGYRAGVRTRWLLGDVFWLVGNYRRQGRPDSVPRARSAWIFLADFARTRHYDHLDWRDPRPAVAELKRIVAVTTRVLPRHLA